MSNGGISPYSDGSGGAGGPGDSGGSGNSGGPGNSSGRSPLEALYALIAVAIVFVFALLTELWKYPWQVWAFFAGCALLGYLFMRFMPYTVKTAQGRAFIYTLLVGRRLVRVFRLGGVYQSATYLGLHWGEPVFAYHRAFDAVFEADRELAAQTGHGVHRVLALGGGGFAWPKHALLTRPDLILGVVEIDPKVIECAEAWFYVDRLEKIAGKRLHIIEGDGRAYIEERAERIAQTERVLPEADSTGECAAVETGEDAACEVRGDAFAAGTSSDATAGSSAADTSADIAENEGAPAATGKFAARQKQGKRRRVRRFDAIVNDTFTGKEPVRALATVEAARAVQGCLTPGGVYAMNVVSSDDGQDLTFLRDEVATLKEVFAYVYVLPVDEPVWAGEDNYIVLATDGMASFDGTIPYDDDFLGTPLYDADGTTVSG